MEPMPGSDHPIFSTLRCIITYTWSEQHFSGGSVDFGVKSEDDPRIEEEKQKLIDRNMFIRSVRFW